MSRKRKLQDQNYSLSAQENKEVFNVDSNDHNQIVIHIDVDSFYTEAECLRDPSLRGKPFVVRQGNGGGFVAVSYEAREFGVRKGDGVGPGGRANIAKLKGRMGEKDAIKRCEGRLIVRDMDTEHYRLVSQRLACQIQEICHGMDVEKASIDDFYVLFNRQKWQKQYIRPNNKFSAKVSIAVTGKEGTGVEFISYADTNDAAYVFQSSDDEEDDDRGLDNRFPFCPEVVSLAQALIKNLELPVTIGISSNKLLSKLVGGLNKPKGLTLLSPCAIDTLLRSTPLQKLPGFRGKLGEAVLQCTSKAAMSVFDLRRLQNDHLMTLKAMFGRKRIEFLRDIGRGIDNSDIQSSKGFVSKTLIVEKSFLPGSDFQLLAGDLSMQLLRRFHIERPHEYPLRLFFKWRHGYTSLSTTSSKTIQAPTGLIKCIVAISKNTSGMEKTMSEAGLIIKSLTVSTVPLQSEVTRLLIGASDFVPLRGQANMTKFFIAGSEQPSLDLLPLERASTPTAVRPIQEVVHSNTKMPDDHKSAGGSIHNDSSDCLRVRVTCPVCQKLVLQINANAHVESHFTKDTPKRNTKAKISSYFKKKYE